jgi:flagella basal body P-ring formation protein FlgA
MTTTAPCVPVPCLRPARRPARHAVRAAALALLAFTAGTGLAAPAAPGMAPAARASRAPAATPPADPAQAAAVLALATLGDPGLAERVQRVVAGQIPLPPAARAEIRLGRLDGRLQLAPCADIDASLPAGQRAWGATRVRLRCARGPVAWQVWLPVTVQVWAPSTVARRALSAGQTLEADDLAVAVVDLAAEASGALREREPLLGRQLARPLAAGEPLREDDLRARQWFAAGERVRLQARGPGFAVASQGEALGPGIDGQRVRVRTESGRIVNGLAVGEHLVELRL